MNAPTELAQLLDSFGPVESVIPHRPPFLMIDAVEQAAPGESAISRYTVDPAMPLFAGHFPGKPVFPGVLVIENMAQTACWVMAAGMIAGQAAGEADGDASGPVPPEAEYRLVRVVQCTFSNPVMPGDCLRTEVRLTRSIPPFAQFHCIGRVGNRKVAEAELLVASKAPATLASAAADGQPETAHS